MEAVASFSEAGSLSREDAVVVLSSHLLVVILPTSVAVELI